MDKNIVYLNINTAQGETKTMSLEDVRVLQLVHHEFEDLELWYPVLRLREEGVQVDIVGEKSNETYYGKYGVPAKAELGFSEVNPESYNGLLVPGGWAPDKLRRIDEVITLIRYMNDMKKSIGQICHAGWVLISADIIRNKKVTSTLGIKDDMQNAGANWLDEEVVIDGHLVSSRRPADLPAYMKAFIKVIKKNQ